MFLYVRSKKKPRTGFQGAGTDIGYIAGESGRGMRGRVLTLRGLVVQCAREGMYSTQRMWV